jgi:Glyoxalase/Bleomycin resistance protein/Dioxygenase superfamily
VIMRLPDDIHPTAAAADQAQRREGPRGAARRSPLVCQINPRISCLGEWPQPQTPLLTLSTQLHHGGSSEWREVASRQLRVASSIAGSFVVHGREEKPHNQTPGSVQVSARHRSRTSAQHSVDGFPFVQASRAGSCHSAPVIKRIVAYADGDDLAASRDFYVEVLGLSVAMEDPVLGLASPTNPTAQVLIPPRGMENPPPRLGIDVGEPEAVDAAHAEAVHRGLGVVYPLTNEPWGGCPSSRGT